MKDDSSSAFLIAEFNHIRDIWKHIDSRTESAIRQYFTVVTILLSGIAFTYDKYLNSVNIVLILSVFIFGSASFSFLVLRRILQTILRKIEYFNAMNSIRAYFVSKNPEVRNYLVLPIKDMYETSLVIENKYKRKSRSFSVILFTTWVSIQLSVFCLLLLYYSEITSSIPVFIGIGIFLLVLTFSLVTMHNKIVTRAESDKVKNIIPLRKKENSPNNAPPSTG